MLQDVFSHVELCTSVSADECVAEGLAIRGAIVAGVSKGMLEVWKVFFEHMVTYLSTMEAVLHDDVV
jgi:molecular chaperone DnaK (HSP70)